MHRLIPFLLVLLCGFLGLYAFGVYGIGQELEQRGLPEPIPQASPSQLAFYKRLQKGKELYDANCSRCHPLYAMTPGPRMPDLVEKYKGEEECYMPLL